MAIACVKRVESRVMVARVVNSIDGMMTEFQCVKVEAHGSE